MELVFVYGTLRQGELNHHLMSGARLIARMAQIQGVLMDTGRGYPAVVQEDSGVVAGELYEVSAEMLARLDELEDFYGPKNPANEYERIRTAVTTDSGQREAWVYVYLKREHDVIAQGDWKLHLLRQNSHVLYFAYGSCMDLERITLAGAAEWFADVRGRGAADGFNLQFTYRAKDGGRADLVEDGGRTEGKLYRIPTECLDKYLYLREGVNSGMYRPAVLSLQCEDGSVQDAVTFLVVDKNPEMSPPGHYMREILRGARPIVSSEYYGELEERFWTSYGFRLEE
ncbi:gamma-glutamylcyclotransferase [Paenibacillus sp. 7124]|uniref:Gamma-glutamylcyclotransferase n=1 Tax=Paenibacillus apii TaxID=1850370 RepID=A0A6M1PUD2_9BACL|nr:gamma-glutamylcyclotransferase family protein [Paenibacillus apii]NGM85612.1 gamma-glutamylcyclotransferase [Paenibacillus apii]NJJ40706.1 gamma-glutamylcyclotransferase [Paenibacillus apii]